ncbi:MAG TPA: CdaR family protein [Bryobacteraceae bacterium]|nr:CdaR family protein [Bryobacteraceae bacterium]
MRALIDKAMWIGLSLASAFGLWYWFANEREIAATVPVTVTYRNLPPDLEITADPPARMFLRLRGPASRLSEDDLRSTTLTFDLGHVHGSGEVTVPVTARELGLPGRVTLLRAVPSRVRFQFDRRLERNVPVEVRYIGPPPDGYRIRDQQITPATVRIAGPEPAVQRSVNVVTDAINLSSTVGRAEFRVPVSVEDPAVRLLDTDGVVTVQIQLEKIPRLE